MDIWYVCVVTNQEASHLYPIITQDPFQLLYDIKHVTNPAITIPSSMQSIVYLSHHAEELDAQRELSMLHNQTHLQKIQYIAHTNPELKHVLT